MLKLWHISDFFRTFFTFTVKFSLKRLVYRILCRNILFNNRVAGWLIVYTKSPPHRYFGDGNRLPIITLTNDSFMSSFDLFFYCYITTDCFISIFNSNFCLSNLQTLDGSFLHAKELCLAVIGN